MRNIDTILFCNYGRRVQLLKFLKQSLGDDCRIICADNSLIASTLYVADRRYVVPRITDEHYIDTILQICKGNSVQAITTLINPEIELLSRSRDLFLQHGISPLCPKRKTAARCFDKLELYKYLTSKGIHTVLTYNSITSLGEGLEKGDVNFPVFIKPVSRSDSVGIHKVQSLEELRGYFDEGGFTYIIQEFMGRDDCGADVYIDTIPHEPVAVFSKHGPETKIGGASRTVSFKDERLFDFGREICKVLEFNDPVGIDFWYKDDECYLSEVSPRFGGVYLHTYDVGVNFFRLIVNNMKGIRN